MAIHARPISSAPAVPVVVPRRVPRVRHFFVAPSTIAFFAIATACAIPLAVGAKVVDVGPGSWFDGLATPDWLRTEWLFGGVQVVLAALLALGGWLVWRRDGPELERRRALAMLAVELVVMSGWLVLLFGEHTLDLSLLVGAALWLTTLGLLTTLAPANPWAALLGAPVFAWATYAFVVNAWLVLSG